MKKRFLLIILSLATVLCAAFGLAGCDFLLSLRHTHTPLSDWESDETYHWHECTSVSCSEKLDKEQHTSTSFVCLSTGHYKICSVCGVKYDEGTHTGGEACTVCGYNPEHVHSLEYVAGNDATCTEDGNVEYWHCTDCDKNFSDESATTVLLSVVVEATGHSTVSMHDATTHWQECEDCHTILVPAQEHSSSSYVMNKEGHYKICTECGVKFAEGTHADGEDCTICGYTANYEDMCASDYGYNYLGTLENGEKYQSLYNRIDDVARGFHSNESKDAAQETVSGSVVYVAGSANYLSLGLTIEQAQSVWATYRHDHPLYYWLVGQVVYSSISLSLCVDADYIDGTKRVEQNELIYSAIDEYLNAVQGETSAYNIAFAFHDMIIDSIDYAYDDSGNAETANYAHSVLGVLNGEGAVCEGYAKAFTLLLNASGVENVYVTGSSRGVGHAWNMVKLDDAWYWYDLTWDDQPSQGSGIVYSYMCKAGTTFTDHTVGETGNMDSEKAMNFLYEIPAASTVAYNTSSLEYGEQFTSDGITYELCGYNKLSVLSSSSLTGAVVLTETVTYSEHAYTLTEIGTSAFTKNTKITSLTIPKSVKVIYNFAVNGCSKLTSVTFEDKVGWSRTSNNGTAQIAESSLESATDAATLLKQTYSAWFTSYEYTWVKA
ncbi:MAG: transglutaminase domain-containing protein [Candidatus Coproplasma sp.]